jgi:hypothetical protein
VRKFPPFTVLIDFCFPSGSKRVCLSATLLSTTLKDDQEAVSTDWLSPSECLERFAAGTVALPPPQVPACALLCSQCQCQLVCRASPLNQWLLMSELAKFPTVSLLKSEIHARRSRKPSTIMPHLIASDVDASSRKVFTLALPGDFEHPETTDTAPKLMKRMIWCPTATGSDRITLVERAVQ